MSAASPVVTDANIARTADVPAIRRWAPYAWAAFEWVVWVRLADGRYGWSLLSDQLIERSPRGEQWAFELAYLDAVGGATSADVACPPAG